MDEMKKGISRRKFLASGTVAVGACSLAAGMTAGSLIVPKTAHAETLTFPLAALDVEQVRQYGYCEYFQSGCGHGGGTAVVRGLIDALPDSDWAKLPYGMFGYANGGGVGWGAMCGSIASILAVFNLAGVHGSLGPALVSWYENANFPLANLDGYVPPTTYAKPVPIPILDSEVEGHSVPESPLCHNSVSKWMAAAGVNLESADELGRNLKKDRCSKVTGDAAGYAAQLINDYLAGLMPAAWAPDKNYAGCYECHVSAPVAEGGLKNASGKMECTECHSVKGRHPR
ncbi:hypothetical protein SAMN02745165_01991 [Malonomonas rubra DSM 5091]|uniref:Uncharacterized protein n=1 Tax=Malonomonas rubra DSM 5091 TaxID=1122189 RepID=A0A1M6I3E1_MALRU|nr:hypothetical protein [Malonomonas rubra]SHJ28864.1 hypothetical protein SAMN02745165_01991 [Malonomonas rubra DSM 5091]